MSPLLLLIHLALRRSIAQNTIHAAFLAIRKRQLQEPAGTPLSSKTFLKLASDKHRKHDQCNDDEKGARDRVLEEALFERKEEVAERRKGRFRRDLRWRGDDLGESLEDRGAAWYDRVAGDGGVPVATVLV